MSTESLEPQPATTSTFSPRRLSIYQQVALLSFLLSINSLLAALGSMVWAHIPYWPAFMIIALVCSYHNILGILLAVLTPVISTLLGIGGSPLYIYVFVDLIQALLVIAAFGRFSISPSLAAWPDILKYLTLAVAFPSAVGGTLLWVIRHLISQTDHDPFVFHISWWTFENLVPALIPGIWLHRVVGELVHGPYAWRSAGRSRSYARKTFEYAIPWMITLIIVGVLVVFIVLQRIGGVKPTLITWKQVHDAVGEHYLLPYIVTALSISILYALGCSVRYAKESWVLEEAVRRHSPTREVAERILSGTSVPVRRRLVTIIFTDIRNFTENSSRFPPDELLEWLNTYFDAMCDICTKRGACIDKFIGDGMMVVFGIEGTGAGAREAISCGLAMLEHLKILNSKFTANNYPVIRIGIGIHCGTVIAGEIGSRDRRQFTVIGSTVNIASRIESRTKELPPEIPPIILSADVLREAGLLLDGDCQNGFVPIDGEMRNQRSYKFVFN